jgi:hypothetical protein
MRTALFIGTGLLVGGGLWWLGAAPQNDKSSSNPISTTTRDSKDKDDDRKTDDDREAKITWSVNKLKATIFPGITSTVKIDFRSSEKLTNVSVEATPSLKDVLSISPASFGTILPNQNYQLTFTLKVPPEFRRAQLEGVVRLIRKAGKTLQLYKEVLEVEIHVSPNPADDQTPIGILTADPSTVFTNRNTNVTITTELTDPRVIPANVFLQRVDSANNLLTVVGRMKRTQRSILSRSL